ncbi:MAG: hypothetical protein JSS96_01055 [Bacteroidetes bacterium]|nr:hypothetical protein [Bacteroidota bacterium]
MLQKPDQLRQAHDLYFQTDMSQSQIAELLNVNRKTLYLWMKEGNWQQVKRSARHTPSILAEQYYRQLAAINDKIEAREDQPYPTREEAEIIRKLTLTIGRIKTGQTVSEHIETMTRFMEQLKTEAPSLVKEILPYTDSFIKKAKQPSTQQEVLAELMEERQEELAMQEQNANIDIPAPRQLFQNEINLPELKTMAEKDDNTQLQAELNTMEAQNGSEIVQPDMGHEWGINPRVDDPESLAAKYLEEKYAISHDPYVSRYRGITIIRAGSPLWGRDKPLWW